MATYRAIAASEVDPDSPVTATLMEALADNPTAIAEGASGAPKIAMTATAAQSGAGNLDFSNLDAFSGCRITAKLYGGSIGGDLSFSYSTDGGSTFSTPVVVMSATGGDIRAADGHFDFASGALTLLSHLATGGNSITASNTTVAGSSTSITDLRFDASGTNANAGVFIEPNGGDSAS